MFAEMALKRKRDSSNADRPRYGVIRPRLLRNTPHIITTAGGAPQTFYPRAGYGSVPRARGQAVQGEMKYFDCLKQATAIGLTTTTWVAGTLMNPTTTVNLGDAAVATPACLFAPKVTASLNGRIGRKVKVFKIKINGTIIIDGQADQTDPQNAAKIRWMLVMDMQTNAAAMTSAQLMNDAADAETTLNSFQNPNNFGRFKVLKEKIFIMAIATSATNAGDLEGVKRPFKCTYRFNPKDPLVVNFNATNGGTVADIIDNSFHVICATDYNTSAPKLTYYSRVCYKE